MVGHEINGVKVLRGLDGKQSVFLLADDRTIQIKTAGESIAVGRTD